ncbi:MAG: NERD domain-containing protein [Clostridium sp.]|nr:NERD domain-containing protein [Clostridium sp.]
MGEFWVRIELNKLPKDKYIVFNDIMIKNEKGTHQIDHIVLSNYGIFVIEMKNYYGLIKGKEYDNKWCQYLGKNKNYFLNPIHQNYGHIKTLSELLNIPGDKFISIICFSNQAKVVVDCKNPVVKVDYLINEIKKYKKEDIDINIKNIENVIMSNNIVDDKIRKQHVKNIHNQIKANDELVNNMICPKCNSKLVEKNGKYGKFIGCSNFPKCNYIKK